MSQQRWQRLAPLSGLVFVALIIIGFVIGGSSPDTNDSNAKITAYLAKDSNQTKNIVAWLLLMVAMVFLVIFYSALRSRLASAEGGVARFGTVAFGAGMANMTFLILAISIFIAPVITAQDADKFTLDPGIYRLTQDLGYMVWVASSVVGALVAWASAAVFLRTGLLPKWFARASVAAGVISLFGMFFFPIFVYWLWILVTSILLFRRGEVEPALAT